ASASAIDTPSSSTRRHRPDLPCWLRFHSSIDSSADSGWAMARLGPSASTLSSESVTTVAISRIESRSVSSPVISRSIQTRRPWWGRGGRARRGRGAGGGAGGRGAGRRGGGGGGVVTQGEKGAAGGGGRGGRGAGHPGGEGGGGRRPAGLGSIPHLPNMV